MVQMCTAPSPVNLKFEGIQIPKRSVDRRNPIILELFGFV
jgi:hypothetical protein